MDRIAKGCHVFQPAEGYEIVAQTRCSATSSEYRLVLGATGIPFELVRQQRTWYLVVRSEDAPRALAELGEYQREESATGHPSSPVDAPSSIVRTGSLFGVVVYCMVLMSVAYLTAKHALGHDWYLAGQMSAADVIAGQWYRTVTALTLHVDPGHLGSNLVYGSVFGFMASRILGAGPGWLVVLLGGALGNGINALLRPAEHISIGASTAVFSALGVILAHAVVSTPRGSETRPLVRWAPVICGLILFGYLGIGDERTDVGAHAAGMVAGFFLALPLLRVSDRWLDSRPVTWAALGIGVSLISVCWVIALWVAKQGVAIS
ncbi:rhomboid family intramembrane serine protease [Crateriforma conspicua]|uniref:Rhomboid family protein n=1 Tax=Crateriforma conspicua TaxID=2527996 RepID=A0A5C6FJ14_9PLAN|nr:rhomboid family intramembrane serine protease [Crateriforma conspicua]TWU60935.1 Rhomboid family protein [Crateriforma conspicua]